jgi:hypothetical protein
LFYKIYSNNGTGRPIDYGSPIGSTMDLSIVIGPLAAPSDNRFAVRAFDPSTNLEEANTVACVPHALIVRSIAGGGCRAAWAYNSVGQGGAPIGFYVFLTPGNTPSYTTPAATVAYLAGATGYASDLSGLTAGSTYTIAVRSYNDTAIENNTTVVAHIRTSSVTANPVDSLIAAAT